MSESSKDLLLAIALTAFGVSTLVVLAHTSNNGVHVADVVDFATLPRIYALMLTALSAVLVIGAALRRRRDAAAGSVHAPSALSNPVVLGRAAGTVALTVLYVLGIEHLAFFPVTAVYLAASFVLYGRRPFVAVALAALLGAGALDLVFVRIINLPLH